MEKEYRVVANCSALNIRSGVGTSYPILNTITKGTIVQVLSTTSNGWYKIKVGCVAGFVSGTCLSNPFTSELSISNKSYKVVKGDTLYSIAKANGVTVGKLKEWNNLTSEAIKVGQVLVMNSNYSDDNYYIVKQGDTLFSIAKKYNLTVAELKKINNLETDLIYVGQKIAIKPASQKTNLVRPAEGVVSSEFGYRQSLRKNHFGIDISKKGNVKVVAITDGIVTRSYKSTSYGEVLFIKHNINGKMYEVVYAHLRENSRMFKVGDKVKAGQQIAWMGSTGDSTGQHLHLEIHEGNWNNEKTNAVNPRDILEF